jgi:hypothetical protein
VIPIAQVSQVVDPTSDARIVLDATGVDTIPLQNLARAVRWHRRVLPRGRLVIAVSRSTARCLVACGLHTVLPHRFSLESALDAAAAGSGAPVPPPRQG